MKIRICAALLIALLTALVLSGCSLGGLFRTLDAAEDAVEHRLDVLEDAAEAAVRPSVSVTPSAQRQDAPEMITGEEAMAIALTHAGFTADQVRSLRTEFEIDDRIAHYDVSFREGRWEFEYEIHAETGAVLSFEKDD